MMVSVKRSVQVIFGSFWLLFFSGILGAWSPTAAQEEYGIYQCVPKNLSLGLSLGMMDYFTRFPKDLANFPNQVEITFLKTIQLDQNADDTILKAWPQGLSSGVIQQGRYQSCAISYVGLSHVPNLIPMGGKYLITAYVPYDRFHTHSLTLEFNSGLKLHCGAYDFAASSCDEYGRCFPGAVVAESVQDYLIGLQGIVEFSAF